MAEAEGRGGAEGTGTDYWYELCAAWYDLCEAVDTEVYTCEYLPAGGTRSFAGWRDAPPDAARMVHGGWKDPLLRPLPGERVRPPGTGGVPAVDALAFT